MASIELARRTVANLKACGPGVVSAEQMAVAESNLALALKAEIGQPTATNAIPRTPGRFNFAWCIIFLRNGGERIRAIMLARDGLGITLTEAREWVDTVKLKRKVRSRAAQRKLHAEYPGGISHYQLRDYLEYEVSHWPNSDHPTDASVSKP